MIDVAALAGALSLGALSTAHCAGMCGPLAVGACVRSGKASGGAAASYVAGRLVSYAALGAVVGAMGRHALCRLPVRSVEVGAAFAVGALAFYRGAVLLWPARPKLLGLRVKPKRGETMRFLASLLPTTSLGLGLATGFLPCGMLLTALALAAASASPVTGAAAMAVFSLASAPGVLGAMAVRRFLGDRAFSPRLVAAAWCALGLAMVARPWVVAAHCAMR